MNVFLKLNFYYVFVFLCLIVSGSSNGQQKNDFAIIAYYAGGPESLDSFAFEKLTHVIHSFSFLEGNQLRVQTKQDSLTIQRMVQQKKRNSKLKVLLSLGGWGGCATCSDVFSLDSNRKAFSRSVKELNDYFHTDGIDLDWEFPALPSLPGHSYRPEDKQNFTLLVRELRQMLGDEKEISFAAGGFKWTLNQSIEWGPVMQLVNRVHLMSYDFTRSPTGHNSSLFSTPEQKPSADHFIKYLMELGVPAHKIVPGAAFYARVWDSVPSMRNGLYQQGKVRGAIHYKDLEKRMPEEKGFKRFWDTTAHAPYIYNSFTGEFASYENVHSVAEKTVYAKSNKLGGIMFWQLGQDKYSKGLLEAIYASSEKNPE